MKKYSPEVLKREEIKIRDRRAEIYTEAIIKVMGKYVELIERKTILKHLSLDKDDVILNAGCGVGRTTIELSKMCKKVYAIDYSPISIEVLNKNLRKDDITNVESYVGDITETLPKEITRALLYAFWVFIVNIS